ncbi:cyclase family protein [Actinocorallia sp. A-T 12471]|uniref:cyclase family protein n=1 Tax=Actinocorallia sp. A-T 12471 TaxID=3089813 RepID=UPI0029CF1891|nr:cyclase family protein [Actinocorallia sp. A-T 12471]MDX6743572.1 cyclase family protein [Actinocorallia sp. A-T 12471]
MTADLPGARRLVDLSHPVVSGMATVPGLPGPEIADHMTHAESRERYAPGTEFHFARVTLLGNTGTYLDAPLHRYEDGTDLAGLPLASFADLDGVVIRAEGVTEIGPELFADRDLHGKAVLVHTGFDRTWGTDAYLSGDHPYLDAAAAALLVAEGVALLGIDSQNVDSMTGGERPAHTELLGAGIPIVEHMTGLAALPDEGFRFHAAPPALVGVGTFTVRAYAVVG